MKKTVLAALGILTVSCIGAEPASSLAAEKQVPALESGEIGSAADETESPGPGETANTPEDPEDLEEQEEEADSADVGEAAGPEDVFVLMVLPYEDALLIFEESEILPQERVLCPVLISAEDLDELGEKGEDQIYYWVPADEKPEEYLTAFAKNGTFVFELAGEAETAAEDCPETEEKKEPEWPEEEKTEVTEAAAEEEESTEIAENAESTESTESTGKASSGKKKSSSASSKKKSASKASSKKTSSGKSSSGPDSSDASSSGRASSEKTKKKTSSSGSGQASGTGTSSGKHRTKSKASGNEEQTETSEGEEVESTLEESPDQRGGISEESGISVDEADRDDAGSPLPAAAGFGGLMAAAVIGFLLRRK